MSEGMGTEVKRERAREMQEKMDRGAGQSAGRGGRGSRVGEECTLRSGEGGRGAQCIVEGGIACRPV